MNGGGESKHLQWFWIAVGQEEPSKVNRALSVGHTRNGPCRGIRTMFRLPTPVQPAPSGSKVIKLVQHTRLIYRGEACGALHAERVHHQGKGHVDIAESRIGCLLRALHQLPEAAHVKGCRLDEIPTEPLCEDESCTAGAIRGKVPYLGDSSVDTRMARVLMKQPTTEFSSACCRFMCGVPTTISS